MPDIWPITSPVVIALFVAAPPLSFAWMLWRRQWTWAGLAVGLGCGLEALIHLNVPTWLIFDPDYADWGIVWLYTRYGESLAWGWPALVLGFVYLGAMIAAMRPPNKFGTVLIVLACTHMLIIISLTNFQDILSFSDNQFAAITDRALPVWILPPLVIALSAAPFAFGIIWSLLRQSRADKPAMRAILDNYSLTIGIALIIFTIMASGLVATVRIAEVSTGAVQKTALYSVTIYLVLLLIAGTLSFRQFRRAIIEPVLTMLERLRNDETVADLGQVNPVWRSFAAAIEGIRGRARTVEDELAEERAALRALYDYAPLQIYVTELDHKLVLVNDWVFRETGIAQFHPSKVIGMSADLLVPQAWAVMSHENDAAVVERGEVTQVEVRGEFGGKVRDIMSIRFPIRDEEGRIFRIGGFVVDISAQKRAEAALAAQQAQLHQSEKLAALGQLLAGVAHELNNPLTVVIGRSAILEEKLKDTPHARAIADMREAADRCNRIVKTFLAMARQSAPRRSTVTVNDTIEAALDMTAYGLRSAGVELVLRLDPDLPAVEADEDQLVQVFTNLLINATHALDGTSQHARLTVTTSSRKGMVVAEFADNGPGIPPDILPRIFEPFYTTKAVGEGTGMGLAMARGIVDEHGGTLLYADAPGGGAVFTVTLPVGAAVAPPPPDAADTQLPVKARGRVLVIDDEPAIRSLLVDILESADLECVECGDGSQAAAMLDRQAFDLIFCDVRMPVMDGVRFRQHVGDRRPEMLDRLIFTSGDVLQRSAPRYAAIAEHRFIEKPFNPAEIRKLVLEMLEETKAAR